MVEKDRKDDSGRRRAKLLRWGWPLAAASFAGALLGVFVAWAIDMPRVETLSKFRPSLITEIQDRRGETFATFSLQRRRLLEESEIPELLKQALLASEDNNFYQHSGVDVLAVLRTFLSNLRAGEITGGASTLTMQLARVLFLTSEETWKRKVEQALLAVELEKHLSKDQILTLYVNLINVGNGNYGMAAAARDYFNKSASELDEIEVATLVGILPAPSSYNPYERPDLVLQRRNSVLRRMHDAEVIDEAQLEDLQQRELSLVFRPPKRRLAPFMAEDVRKYLEKTYGTEAVVEGGLLVSSTLDPQIQRTAEEALRESLVALDRKISGWRGAIDHLDEPDLESFELETWNGTPPVSGYWYQGIVLESGSDRARVKIEDEVFDLTAPGFRWTRRPRPDKLLRRGDVAWFRLGPIGSGGIGGTDETGKRAKPGETRGPTLFLEQEPEIEGAVVVLESASGAVRAMVGGWSFERSKFNRVTQARRQVGSAFKAFVFGAAIELGYTPADTIFDAPTSFLGGDNTLSYKPRNFYRNHYGILTLRRALEQSGNIAAVKILDMIGVERVIDFARTCGVESDLPPYPSLALGVSEMTPLELAAAYAAIANHGTHVGPYMIERVHTPEGRLLEEHLPKTKSAADPRTITVLTSMLEGVVDRGTAADLKGLDIDIAGKTGTTDDNSDAWFVGFTPRYTMLVWVGRDDNKPIGRNMTGGKAALPIWKKIAEAGLRDGWLKKGERFSVPAGVLRRPVEYFSGLLTAPGAERVIDERFVEGTEPAQIWEPRWAEILELPWFQQGPFYIPKEGERMPDEWDRMTPGGAGETEAQTQT